MRQALGNKNVNRQENAKSDNASFKGGFSGKMTRQVGRVNLHEEVQKNNSINLTKCTQNAVEDFVVYEDPTPAKENDNNIIHELERKMATKQIEKEKEEKIKVVHNKLVVKQEDQHQKFMMTRESDLMSVYDDVPSTAPSVCGTVQFDDDDFDRYSAVSSTTVVRTELSLCHVEDSTEEIKFRDSDVDRKYAKTLAEKERRLDDLVKCDLYYNDIYRYMLHRQTKVRPSSRYMSKQAEVTAEMRSILIDWFNDVATEYGLQQETLHLAVALVDRVLSKFCVEKHRLQLVGTTALMIAAKYEEIYPPEILDFAHITDDTFRVDQILMMERYLLSQLDFSIATPTTNWFGACFAKRQDAKQRTRTAMEYLIDLSLIEYDYLKFRPSHIAAACLCFANVLTDEEPWTEKLEQETDIKLSSFAVILPVLHKSFKAAPKSEYPSIYNKYGDNSLFGVSKLPAPEKSYVVETSTMMTICPQLFAEKSTSSI